MAVRYDTVYLNINQIKEAHDKISYGYNGVSRVDNSRSNN